MTPTPSLPAKIEQSSMQMVVSEEDKSNPTRAGIPGAKAGEKARVSLAHYVNWSSRIRLVSAVTLAGWKLSVNRWLGLAANLLTLLALTHTCFPRARHHTRKFYRLSYYSAASEKYALGWDDSFLVIYWIVVFTGLRAVMLDYVLTPLAQILGLEKRKEKTRFAEQAWLLIYYIGISPLGMVFATPRLA